LVNKVVEGRYRSDHGIPEDEPLSSAQHAEIGERLTSHTRYAQARDKLHGLVSTWGLLQYLIAPVSLLWAVVLAVLKSTLRFRLVAAAAAVAALVCVVLMFYRGYFTSLGW
jgi:hypothetical protein